MMQKFLILSMGNSINGNIEADVVEVENTRLFANVPQDQGTLFNFIKLIFVYCPPHHAQWTFIASG